MIAKKIKPHLLIVGGTGFIGYHLASFAKKLDWKVSSISLNKPKESRHIHGVNYLIIDISNLKELKKKLNESFTYVVNLSGYVKHILFGDKEDEIIKTHFIGLINLTKIFSKKKIKKFVQIGSSSEYGDVEAPQDENLHGLPNTSYALAKLASTQFLLMLHKTKKFPACVLRFFQVYGPKQDQNRVLPKTIQSCLKNKKFPASKGDQIRDFCYVDDAVKAIFLALKSNKSSGEIINIGLGKAIKIKQAINTIHKIIGKGQIQFGKIKYREDENMSVYPDIKKARIKLKWKPRFSFNRGIKTVINSFK